MNQLSPISDRLATLIPMLGSDKDGEVIATVRAIGRQLEKVGADWHALADAVRGHQDDLVTNDWSDLIDHVLLHGQATLALKDREFVLSMRSILARGFEPTEKQAAWLRSLHERFGASTEEAA